MLCTNHQQELTYRKANNTHINRIKTISESFIYVHILYIGNAL